MGLLVVIGMGFSIILSVIAFFYAIIQRSWKAMLVFFIVSLPISFYFLSVQPPISFIGFLPILFLILAVFFYRKQN